MRISGRAAGRAELAHSALERTVLRRRLQHSAALRQLANRLVGILHGCLKTGTAYDETTAWSHHANTLAA